MLNFRDQTRSGVITRERVCSSWYGRRLIQFSAVATVLLRFGPFARSLCAIVSCYVMERGG